ncbi:MAG: hypothetical protein A2521_15485 [Deltaproteobacteria bacterium RIFOXYD12_FULL_57_12]|nr:MAG: hypothetical protein A2521_15485 [Deltaproteobacteria bacterium RIFOXYD12_FULL_57_12]
MQGWPETNMEQLSGVPSMIRLFVFIRCFALAGPASAGRLLEVYDHLPIADQKRFVTMGQLVTRDKW